MHPLRYLRSTNGSGAGKIWLHLYRQGFDVELGVPFDYDLADAFEKTADKVADACPTAALARHVKE
jgi:hypothetical protein